MINIIYWLALLIFHPKAKKLEENQSLDDIDSSLIVAFKNEEENLKPLLSKLTQQRPKISDIIMVNDHSSDNFLPILSEFEPNIRLINNTQKDGKKAAISLGIESAKHNDLLFTDADCIPATSDWHKLMKAHKSNSKKIVLGYGPNFAKTGLLNAFQRFETWITAMQYFAFAQIGIPYMGVGRNLMYSKELYNEQKNNIQGKHLASGDDDLSISAMATKNNVACCIDPDSFCYSHSAPTLKSFLNQKSRHISTSIYYRWHHKILLGLFSFSQIFIFVALPVILFLLSIPLSLYLSLLSFKMIILFCSLQKLDGKSLLPFSPILEPLLVLYYLILAVFNIFKPNKSW